MTSMREAISSSMRFWSAYSSVSLTFAALSEDLRLSFSEDRAAMDASLSCTWRRSCQVLSFYNTRKSREYAHTCSFFSVSSLREAESVSCVSPLTACVEAGGGGFMDGLREGPLLREADTRGETAERAVAPLVIEDGDEVALDTVGGDRREAGVALAGAAVAM